MKKTLINDQSTDKSLKMMLSTKKQLKNVMPRAEPVSVNPCNRWTMEDEDESIPVIFGFIKNWNINTIDIILFKHPITACQESDSVIYFRSIF